MTIELGNLELHYLDVIKDCPTRGRGEYVRLLLIDAGLEFKYIRYQTFEDWNDQKPQLIQQQKVCNPTLPFMYINGKYYSKTVPLMRFIARKLGQYEGKDDDENQLLDAYSDMIMDWNTYWAFVNYGMTTDEQRDNYHATKGPENYRIWEEVLAAKEGPYILGEKITYVDFLLFHMLEEENKPIDADKQHNLSKFIEAMKNRPNLKAYLASDRK